MKMILSSLSFLQLLDAQISGVPNAQTSHHNPTPTSHQAEGSTTPQTTTNSNLPQNPIPIGGLIPADVASYRLPSSATSQQPSQHRSGASSQQPPQLPSVALSQEPSQPSSSVPSQQPSQLPSGAVRVSRILPANLFAPLESWPKSN
jgi:hypothetical protein